VRRPLSCDRARRRAPRLLEQSADTLPASLLGIQHIVLAVNQMDLIGWDKEKFEAIRGRIPRLRRASGVTGCRHHPDVRAARRHVVTKSDRRPGTRSGTAFPTSKRLHRRRPNLVDVAIPRCSMSSAQTHEHQDHRSYAGTVASGVMRRARSGCAAGRQDHPDHSIEDQWPCGEAFPPMAASVSLADEIDISRGDLIARPTTSARVAQEFDATCVDGRCRGPGARPRLRHQTHHPDHAARITALDYRLDVNTLHRDKTRRR